MTLRPLNPRERLLVGAGAGLAFLALVYGWIVEPLALEWISLGKRIEVREMQLQRDRRLLARQDLLRAAYAERAETASPAAAGGLGGLLREVDRIRATAPQVLVRQLKPQPPREMEGFRLYGVELEVEGPLPALSRLVYELEKSPAGLRVARLRLDAGAEGGVEGRLVITRIDLGEAGG